MTQYRSPEPLSELHDLKNFDCGVPSLNDWLKKRALKNQLQGASRCFVLCGENSQEVLSYYSLSAGAITHQAATNRLRRNIPDPIPVLVLGRLAIHQRFQGEGFGCAMLRDAMIRSANVSAQTGISAILVHALSEEAKKFYLSRGFVQSLIQPMTLMMTLKTVRDILAE